MKEETRIITSLEKSLRTSKDLFSDIRKWLLGGKNHDWLVERDLKTNSIILKRR